MGRTEREVEERHLRPTLCRARELDRMLGDSAAASRQVVDLLGTSVAAGAYGPLIVLSGAADFTIAHLTGVLASQMTEVTRQLMIDVSGLRFADSASIWLLLVVARTLKDEGGSMVLIRPQPAVARILTLIDTDHVITIR